MRVFALLCAVAGVNAASLNSVFRNKSKIDINQKVTVGGRLVFDQKSADVLGQCRGFGHGNVGQDEVKVCGTGIKVTVHMRGCLMSPNESQKTDIDVVVGSCDSGKAVDSCESVSPSTNAKLTAYQSYTVEQCA